MSSGEVLFEGTWEEAVLHAGDIAPTKHVQVVEVGDAVAEASKETVRALIDRMAERARALDASVENQGSPCSQSDPYMQVLEEKFRKQGLRFE